MLYKHILFIGVHLLITAGVCQSFVILTANIEDVENIAKKLFSDPMASKIKNLLTSVSGYLPHFTAKTEQNRNKPVIKIKDTKKGNKIARSIPKIKQPEPSEPTAKFKKVLMQSIEQDTSPSESHSKETTTIDDRLEKLEIVVSRNAANIKTDMKTRNQTKQHRNVRKQKTKHRRPFKPEKSKTGKQQESGVSKPISTHRKQRTSGNTRHEEANQEKHDIEPKSVSYNTPTKLSPMRDKQDNKEKMSNQHVSHKNFDGETVRKVDKISNNKQLPKSATTTQTSLQVKAVKQYRTAKKNVKENTTTIQEEKPPKQEQDVNLKTFRVAIKDYETRIQVFEKQLKFLADIVEENVKKRIGQNKRAQETENTEYFTEETSNGDGIIRFKANHENNSTENDGVNDKNDTGVFGKITTTQDRTEDKSSTDKGFVKEFW